MIFDLVAAGVILYVLYYAIAILAFFLISQKGEKR